MYINLGGQPAMLISAAFALNTIGQFALVALLATFLLSRVVYHCSPVLFNLLLVCLAATVPQYFLMYAGQIYNPNPPAALCATQAALVEGLHCAFAVVSLCLVVEYLAESHTISSKTTRVRYLKITLVALPYLTFLPFSLGVGAYGVSHPGDVRHMPNDLTCTLQNRTLITGTRIVIAILVIVTLATTGPTVTTAFAVIHTLTTRKHLFCKRLPPPSLSRVARIASFALFQATLLIFNVLRTYVASDFLRVAYMVLQALTPLITALNFGSKVECYQAWKSAAIGLSRDWFSKRSCQGTSTADARQEMRIVVDKSVSVVVD
ncbi:hypothetical protein BN946_scf185007.g169 [Trametes cinnabarina]|uniref:G-protein coupled receptors family 1 profile domain-containing protein n=1 Tax=Pycnoporus cinnabarinus TaxID=5643 RepID=A0A060SFF9_PYCCI|nr:hypothetical protein BN946_scf185007.g169 [Trametes cinnabarina]